MVFVNSMSDLFQEDIPSDYVRAVVDVMAASPWHIYQVLTKRSARLREMLSGELREFANGEHIWWGVSVENRKYGLPRLEDLQKAPAAVRFLSVEPLLEDLGRISLDGIHWVIVGGESGHGARGMEAAWVTSVLRQCQEARVPFFFKQWGGVRKKQAGRSLDGKTYDDSVICASTVPESSRTRSDNQGTGRATLPHLDQARHSSHNRVQG